VQPPDEQSLPATAEAVLTFLESVGRRSEAELYLRIFHRLPKQSFAIIAPGAPVIRAGQGAFTEQLRFLSDLGLCAPIVLGLFDAGHAAASHVVRRLEAAGLAFSQRSTETPDLARVLTDELVAGRWPVLTFPDDPQRDARDKLVWLGQLAAELDTRKLVLLRRRGPLHLVNDKSLALAERSLIPVEAGSVSLINLRSDAELIRGQKLLRKGDAQLFEWVRELLSTTPDENLLVSVTSPLDLLRELFTVRGAGTLIKRGSDIRRLDSYEVADVARLGALFEASFSAPLRPEFFEKPPLAVYVEQDYRAAAVVHATDVGAYLSKFAVDPLAQGEGMGRDVWQAITRDFSSLFWRTRATNPISAWYANVCDGLVRLTRWHVFWRGIGPVHIPEVIAHAAALEDDFERGDL
jgi:acetylglutamate kinase